MKKVVALLLVLMLFAPLLSQAEEERGMLLVSGDMFDSNMNPAFAEKYPRITLQYPMFTEWDVITVMTQIMMPTSPADLFFFQSSRGMLDAVHRKGYCTYFPDSEALQAAEHTWPAFVRDLVEDEKGVFAVPVTLTSNWMFGYNAKVGEALGIDPPGSLEEVMEIFAAWPEKYLDAAEDQGYYLSTHFVSMAFYLFLERGIDMYLAGCEGEITFETPRFHAYLEKLMALKPQLDTLRDENASTLMAEDSVVAEDNALFDWYAPLLRDDRIESEYFSALPISLLRGEEPYVPVDLCAAVLPRNAQHPETAMRYLQTLLENYPPDAQILLHPDTAQAIEEEDIEAILAELEEMMADLQARIDACEEPLERIPLEDELADIRAEYEWRQGDGRYLYTPKRVEEYRSISPLMCQMPAVSYTYYDSQPNLHTLMELLAAGKLPVDNFIAQFDEMQQMMNEENQ